MASPIIEIFRETKKSELKLTCVSELMETDPPTILVSQGSELFLRANKGSDRSVKIPVDFKGRKYDQTTEFYIRRNEKYEAYTFSCCLGGQQYYLCTEQKSVFLLKTNAYDPNNDKFLFRIAFVNRHSRFNTIKSVRTKMFLVSDENGNASMREIKDRNKEGQPEDRQAWFDLVNLKDDGMVTDSMLTFISEDVTFTAKPCEV